MFHTFSCISTKTISSVILQRLCGGAQGPPAATPGIPAESPTGAAWLEIGVRIHVECNSVYMPLERGGKDEIRSFFTRFYELLYPVVVPGAHVFVASNPLLSHLLFDPFISAGFETRGMLIREVHTLRGGDRPKNAHDEVIRFHLKEGRICVGGIP